VSVTADPYGVGMSNIEAERARELLDRAMQDYTNQNNARLSPLHPSDMAHTRTTTTNTTNNDIDRVTVAPTMPARPRQRPRERLSANISTDE